MGMGGIFLSVCLLKGRISEYLYGWEKVRGRDVFVYNEREGK